MTGVLIAAGLLIALMALSLFLSRPSWPYHVGGTRGFIMDTLLYLFLPVVPMLICVLGFSLLVQFRPELENETARFVLLGIAVVGLLGARRLPIVAAAQNRVRAARNARYEAMQK
ncbi:hypothetical protein [Asticcacaulis sp.]|uniref:hypothetical protein n=1 Tax=Asticcacaulis sp. TaxID=1872648 RepID=UPI002CEC84A9|nr:hypothetical protein [Asticcacaulis sp.]HTM82345.1 hypothetical protein [Asticcacaulis sp.]